MILVTAVKFVICAVVYAALNEISAEVMNTTDPTINGDPVVI